jgi:hypothetical protein
MRYQKTGGLFKKKAKIRGMLFLFENDADFAKYRFNEGGASCHLFNPLI